MVEKTILHVSWWKYHDKKGIYYISILNFIIIFGYIINQYQK